MAIVFSLETPTLLAKSDIFIPKFTAGEGGGGSTGLGNIPKKFQFFLVPLLSGIVRSLTNMLGRGDSFMTLENAYDCEHIIGYSA